jgi:3-hydroxyacyl-[acyl-carrier-protein] dehydratase
MPPELVLEAVGQAATWLIMLGSGFRLRAVLLSVDEIVCTRDVVPGDVLAVAGHRRLAHRRRPRSSTGPVSVDGRAVLRAAGIMCALREADTLDAKDNSERLARHLLRTGDVR